ncbi:hypothetical protein FRB94_012601 [Tulasnella sp. JGI-2019a]|nr:hypothetical protein FRB94_012601 [Tulasnella sp. JGI-2019a]
MNITNTWYCTGLICYRLLTMLRQKQATADALNDLEADITAGGAYQRIIRVLIRSGMLFSVTEIAFLICAAAGNQMNTAPLRRNINGNLQQSQSGDSGSYSMPVFRKWVNEESTTGTKGVSQPTAYKDSMEQATSYLAAYGGQLNRQSSTGEGDIERGSSYLAPYGEQSQNPSSSMVTDCSTAQRGPSSFYSIRLFLTRLCLGFSIYAVCLR